MNSKPWQSLVDWDPEVHTLIERELARQCEGLELIASENFASPQVVAAMGNVFTNKYAEGLPGKRYYGGCDVTDALEQLAIDRATNLFRCRFANVQPHSGAQANAAALQALASPGDPILGLNLAHGGHLTHGSPVNFSGLLYKCSFYELGSDERIDYARVEAIAHSLRPRVIIAGASAYPREIDFAAFRRIADACGATLLVDMAHIAGLVAAGFHQSPIPHAHVVTTTTHKTLRGPRGGMILWNDDALSVKLNKAVFPGTQGGPLEHIIAAKAVCLREALQPSFVAYQQAVLNNAKALAETLQRRGMRLVSGGTDNHLLLLDLSATAISGKDLEEALGKVHITVNKNTVPNEKRSPFVTSGIRIGTPAVTSRGLGVREMEIIGNLIADVAAAVHDTSRFKSIAAEVRRLAEQFPLYPHWAIP